MKNQSKLGTPTGIRFALCPSTVHAGDPVLLGGNQPAIALNDYQSVEGGAVFYLNGSFDLTVVANSVLSPASGAAMPPGTKVHYSGGTLDATTNVTTGGTLSAVTADPLFGYIDFDDPGLTSGATGTPSVILQGMGA